MTEHVNMLDVLAQELLRIKLWFKNLYQYFTILSQSLKGFPGDGGEFVHFVVRMGTDGRSHHK